MKLSRSVSQSYLSFFLLFCLPSFAGDHGLNPKKNQNQFFPSHWTNNYKPTITQVNKENNEDYLACFSHKFNQELDNEKCVLNGDLFSVNCIKYIGACSQGKANGWGTLYLKNGTEISGFFKDNIIQNDIIDKYETSTKTHYFGENKGLSLNGHAIYVDFKNDVQFYLYSMDRWSGSGDHYSLPTPILLRSEPFCDADGASSSENDTHLIPNTTNIICASKRVYNKQGDEKFWISVIDLSTNQIVRQFGSFKKPLTMGWQPQFIGVHEGNKAIYYFSNAFQQLDLNTGKIVKLTSIPNELEIKENIHLPDEILFKNKSSGKAASSGYKDYEAEQYHKIIFLKDGSYLKTFNNQLFSNGLEEWKRTYGSGASVVLFNKNHAFVKSIDFPHYNIKDCAVDEISGRFALSYKGADTTYLAYFNLETLRLQSIVFAKANKEYDDDKGQSGYLNQPGEIQFSRTGKYLILSRGYPNNNTVYKENDLYFGFEGHIYDFSEDDGVVLTNFYGSIIAFDLEKRAAFSKFEVRDEIFSTSFFNLKNNLYILSHNYSVSGNTYTINGIKLTHLMMPLPRGSSK